MRMLFLGDVVGRPGRNAVKRQLPALRGELQVDMVVVNAENASGGLGLDPEGAEELFAAGADVLTSGNHIWKYKSIQDYLDRESRLLRPANFPGELAGTGMCVHTLPGSVDGGEHSVAVLNLQGRTFMQPLDCPFRKADSLLATLPEDIKTILVDFHAEATSEKIALARYLDGRVSAVFGTHTHVQTNDARVLQGGTAAITDAGMCGVHDSILGMREEPIFERFLTGMPSRFTLAKGRATLSGAVLETDDATGRAVSIELFCRQPQEG